MVFAILTGPHFGFSSFSFVIDIILSKLFQKVSGFVSFDTVFFPLIGPNGKANVRNSLIHILNCCIFCCYIMTSMWWTISLQPNQTCFVGRWCNRTCLGEFDITMESGLFLDSQVEIWCHNVIGHVCGTGPISESFIYVVEKLKTNHYMISSSTWYIYSWV